ncbi:MAG: hypothetical protein HQL73_09395 [Magnetococcales bacterium]|nr:hypothetical protein [Magnetococcales bacterium]
MSLETIIARLEAVFKRLQASEALGAAELAELNGEWVGATGHLRALTEEEIQEGTAADPFLKPRLQRLVEELPRMTAGLNDHKGVVSQQIMAQNRRIQSMRQGYGRSATTLTLVSRQA